jgi:2Fe-2S ferredoxin
MENNIIKVYVEQEDGSVNELECPTDMGFSLMEMLKAHEYPVLATCGGMALCATCCVDVLEGLERLPEISDDEYAMLDTLPDLQENSRLACQLRISPEMDQLKVKLHFAE